MPNPEIDKLSKDSGDAQIKAATSSCIANEMKRGHPQDQAIAMCMQMVRDKTGKGRAPQSSAPPGSV